jgi:hypothetical protein
VVYLDVRRRALGKAIWWMVNASALRTPSLAGSAAPVTT